MTRLSRPIFTGNRDGLSPRALLQSGRPHAIFLHGAPNRSVHIIRLRTLILPEGFSDTTRRASRVARYIRGIALWCGAIGLLSHGQEHAVQPPNLPPFFSAGGAWGDTSDPPKKTDLSVTDFGAVADGKTLCDDTFRKAIQAGAGKVIGIPAGTFLLADRLLIDEANTTLQGAARDATVLHFTRSLGDIDPSPTQNAGGTPTTSWSWSGGLITLGSPTKTIGKRVTVSDGARRGDLRITVSDAKHFSAGRKVRLELAEHPKSTALIRALYRDQPGDISGIRPGSFSVTQPLTIVAITNNVLTLDRPLRFDVRPAWRTTLVGVDSPGKNIALSDLTIAFPPTPYQGHFKEAGFNGVQIYGMNNRVSLVRVRNADSGFFVRGQEHRLLDITLDSDRTPHGSKNTGHHGFSLTGQDCLLARFQINTRFYHDLTVSRGSVGNVFSEGRGVDLSIDHHRYAPYENLFTQLHAGAGKRVWKSGGGKGRGAHAGSGATFWNIMSDAPFSLPPSSFAPPGCFFVGLHLKPGQAAQAPEGWHVDPVSPDMLRPANLYKAQRTR